MFTRVLLICSLALAASAYQYYPWQGSEYGYPAQYPYSQMIKSALGYPYYPSSYYSSPAVPEADYEQQVTTPYYQYPFFAKYFQQYFKGQYQHTPNYYPYSQYYQGSYAYPTSYQGGYASGYQGPFSSYYYQGYQSPYYQGYQSPYYQGYQSPYASIYQGYQAPYYQGYQGSYAYPLLNKIMGSYFSQYQPVYGA